MMVCTLLSTKALGQSQDHVAVAVVVVAAAVVAIAVDTEVEVAAVEAFPAPLLRLWPWRRVLAAAATVPLPECPVKIFEAF